MLTVLRPRLVPNWTAPADSAKSVSSSAAADQVTGVELGATLTDEDLTRADNLTTEALHAESLGRGVTTVTRAGRTLFVSHWRTTYFPLEMPVTLTWVSGWR